jgi:ssDNA-binding protein
MGERIDLDKKRVVTPEFRLSYPHLFEPQEYQGKNEFSAVAVFPKTTDLTALKKAANAAAAEKWGADMKKWPKNLKSPFRDGDKEREGTDGYENSIFITVKSKQRPHIVDRKMQDIIDPAVFQAGDYGRAEIVAAAYENQGNKGVSFWLWSIQKTKDGERFGGRQHPSQSGAFGPLEDDEPEEFGGGEGEDEAADDNMGF